MTPWPSFETLQVFSQQKPFVTLRKAHYEHARKCVNEREAMVASLRETVRMLEAAHRELGMCSTADNPRIQKARSLLVEAA